MFGDLEFISKDIGRIPSKIEKKYQFPANFLLHFQRAIG